MVPALVTEPQAHIVQPVPALRSPLILVALMLPRQFGTIVRQYRDRRHRFGFLPKRPGTRR